MRSRAGNLAEQLDGLLRREDVKIDNFSAGKPGQSGSAGDKYGVAGAGRQQRANLRLIGRIVKQDKRLPISHQRAVQVDALINIIGDGVPLDAEGAQKSAEHFGRVKGLRLRATQVDVQLPIGELRAQLVSGMDSQRGLSHPRLSDDPRDHHRSGLVLAPHSAVQPFHGEFAPGEVGNIGRQLARYGSLRSLRRARVPFGATERARGGFFERLPIGLIQTQRISKQSNCRLPWMVDLTAFEITDCPYAHARPTSKLVL